MTRSMHEQFLLAFNEDKVVLEEIQNMIDASGEEPRFHLAIDGASNRTRRMLDRLMADEDKATQASRKGH